MIGSVDIPDDPKAKIKRPFELQEVLRRIRIGTKPFEKAAMFQLYDEGYRSIFEQLVACLISIRTYDEISLPTAKALFAVARSPAEIAELSVDSLDELIRPSTFHFGKARQIKEIARQTVEIYDGDLPPEEDVLRALRGVGPKCANLVLGVAAGVPRISVDTHVHRVTNRWGLVQTKTPEKTLDALVGKVPKRHWIELNELLVPFGKHICTRRLPKCSTCPVLSMCRQRGVTRHL